MQSQFAADAWEGVFAARLTAKATVGGTVVYDFEEVVPDPSSPGDWLTVAGGRTGEGNVYALNGEDVAVPTVVWLRFRTLDAGDPTFEFDAGGGSSTVKPVNLLRCFNATKDGAYYKCVLDVWNPITGVYSYGEETDPAALVYALPTNNETLDVWDRFLGRFVGNTAGGVPVYVMDGGFYTPPADPTQTSLVKYDTVGGVSGWYRQLTDGITYTSTGSPLGSVTATGDAVLLTDGTVYAAFTVASSGGWVVYDRYANLAHSGTVSLAAQSFAGRKTFVDGAEADYLVVNGDNGGEQGGSFGISHQFGTGDEQTAKIGLRYGQAAAAAATDVYGPMFNTSLVFYRQLSGAAVVVDFCKVEGNEFWITPATVTVGVGRETALATTVNTPDASLRFSHGLLVEVGAGSGVDGGTWS